MSRQQKRPGDTFAERHSAKSERREKKRRPRMLVSGRGVFTIQRLKQKRAG